MLVSSKNCIDSDTCLSQLHGLELLLNRGAGLLLVLYQICQPPVGVKYPRASQVAIGTYMGAKDLDLH